MGTNYTGKDQFAVLDVVEIERLPYGYNAGLPVGERHTHKLVGEVKTMAFVDVDDAIEYASHYVDNAALIHNRKCTAAFDRDGKKFAIKFRHAIDKHTNEPFRMDTVLAQAVTRDDLYL